MPTRVKKRIVRLLNSGSPTARYPGTSPRIGRRAANSVRCQGLTSPIDLFRLRILVLRGGALGDLVLTLPVLSEIRKSYSGAEVELLGIFPQARLAMPEFVDRVERLDAPNLLPIFVDGMLPETVQTRLAGFDLAINFVPDLDGVIARNLAVLGVKRIISLSPDRRPNIHAAFELADVLDSLGLALRDPVPRLTVGAKPTHSATLGFHLGSGSPQKNWPIDHWLAFIQRIHVLFDDFLLVGGEADEMVVREFLARSNIPHLKTLLNASLPKLCQALNHCALFIGHDTGVTHLAAAVGTPTVALFGPTNPNLWAPLGEHVSIVRSPDSLMASITVDAAVGEACRRSGKRGT
jgi:heptosyltransferase-3